MTLIASYQNNDGTKPKAELSRKTVNLLIFLERDGYNQSLDTMGNVWKREYLQDFTQINTILSKYKEYDILNIGLVHHGNRYCPETLPQGQRELLWGTHFIKKADLASMDEEVSKTMTPDENGNFSIEEYTEKFKEVFGKRFVYEDKYENYIILFFYLKLLLNSIADDGNYISIACDEADDENFLDELSKLTTKNIKLYANTNKTYISASSNYTHTYTYGSKKITKSITDFGSILNIPLTIDINDNRGWFYFNCATKNKQVTGKDIILNSYGKIPFQLIPLINISKEQRGYRQMYHSKNFKNWWLKNGWDENSYKIFLNEARTKF